jgi:AcrR family transcriptional regulator
MRKENKDAKQKIRESARQLFFSTDYTNASMRDVAEKCGMTVGNIYRYYENKEVLFDDIVGKCYEKIVRLIKLNDFVQKFIKNKIGVNEKNVYRNGKFKTHLLEIISKLISENATELFILLNNSSGSKYEQIKDQVSLMIKETILKMVGGIDEDKTEIYSYMIVSTLLFILEKYISNPAKLQEETSTFFVKLFESF